LTSSEGLDTLLPSLVHYPSSFIQSFAPAVLRLDTAVPFEKTARPMADANTGELMEKIVALCKRRGFIFQSSEIYGGLNGFWDTARSALNSSAISRIAGGGT